MTPIEGFYDLELTDINGDAFSFEQLRGKKVIVVNTASECGYTPQYAGLQALYDEIGSDKFEILAFPCNDFGGQEPGALDEIAEFCDMNFGVGFPLFGKVNILSTPRSEIYNRLLSAKYNHVEDAEITWNFHKILIDEKGCYVKNLPSAKEPDGPEIRQWLLQQTLF